MDTRAASRTMNGQIWTVDERVRYLKELLAKSQLAIQKITDESSRTDDGLWDGVSVVDELLREWDTLVERLERILATEFKKRQQLLAERQETSETASSQLKQGEDFFQGLLSKDVAMTVERNKWYELAVEAFEKLNTVEADIALQSSLGDAALKETDAHAVEIAKF